MERKIELVETKIPKFTALKRVAAYARVSSGKNAMLHSLSAQISYYSSYIQKHKDWVYCGVYADEAKTGTKDSRESFVTLLNKCRQGEIDMVITKSISRFARNTVTLLEAVRELKLLGIDIYFEEQNIHTLSAEGELMLTILASYAQEESLSASENSKWFYKKNFEQGILPLCFDRIYGYTRDKSGNFIVVPDEAKIIKYIYSLFLEGNGIMKIAKTLNEQGIVTETGAKWNEKKLRYILSNERYIGDLLLQKYFIADHLTKKKCKNSGEKSQYYVEDNHEPIIDRETFQAVQDEFQKRKKHYYHGKGEKSIFSQMIVCGNCGKSYIRTKTSKGYAWVCYTYSNYGKTACESKRIPETIIMQKIAEILITPFFDEKIFVENINTIKVSGMTLTFCLKNGTEKSIKWEVPSRADSWTDEMKEKARQRAIIQRRENNGTSKDGNGYTTNN